MKKTFVTIFCCCLVCLLKADSPGMLTYIRTFGGSGMEYPLWLFVEPDGSYVVSGYSSSSGAGGNDGIVVKFNSSGQVIWSNTYGSMWNDEIQVTKKTSDGGYIASGTINDNGNQQLYALKLDNNGNIVWQKHFGGNGVDQARNVCELPDGFLFTGLSHSFSGGTEEILVIKTDVNGNFIWGRTYAGPTGGTGGEPVFIGNNSIRIAAGRGDSDGNAFFFTINSVNGNIINSTSLGNDFNESIYMLRRQGNSWIASDATWSPSNGAKHIPWILNFSQNGNLNWIKTYSVGNFNSRIIAEVCPDRSLVFTPFHSGSLQSQAIIVKTDTLGNVVWSKSYDYGGTGRMRQVVPTPDGGFLALGHKGNGSNLDFYIIKTDALGNVNSCGTGNYTVTANDYSVGEGGESISGSSLNNGQNASGVRKSVTLNETDICCATDAGSILPVNESICGTNLPIILIHQFDYVLDINDGLRYIIFTDLNNPLGSIVAMSTTPQISFNSNLMQTNTTYYVSAIAGNINMGDIELDDPCLDITGVSTVVWRPKPQVLITGQPDICGTDCTDITFHFTGTPPFNIIYQLIQNGALITTQSGISTTLNAQILFCPAQYNINPANGPVEFRVIQLYDAFCDCD